MIFGKRAVIGQTSTMLQQLPQCERLVVQRRVQFENAVPHQRQSGSRDDRLAKAEPRDNRFAILRERDFALLGDNADHVFAYPAAILSRLRIACSVISGTPPTTTACLSII